MSITDQSLTHGQPPAIAAAMGSTIRVQVDAVPDALDLEPDIDGIDWIEDDPDLESGPVHLYVHGLSTRCVEVRMSPFMTLDVWVPAGASSQDWDVAFEVLELAAGWAQTEMVEADLDSHSSPPSSPTSGEPGAGEPVLLDDLTALCNETWRAEELTRWADAVREEVAASGRPVQVDGPIRTAFVGTTVLNEIAGDVIEGRVLVDVLRRVQWVAGPHFSALAVRGTAGGAPSTVAVVGPDLRYVLPPTDRLLIETDGELLIPADALESLPGVRVSWLDDGNRLMEPVAEATWPAVVAAARELARA